MIQLQVNNESNRALRFKVEGVPGEVSLMRDSLKEGDGMLWGMQHGTMLKAHYTEADRAHTLYMQSVTPIKHHDIVKVEGRNYRVRVSGNYSDCIRLECMCLKNEWETITHGDYSRTCCKECRGIEQGRK